MLKTITKLAQRTWHRIWEMTTSLMPTKKPVLPTYEFIEDPVNDLSHIAITSGPAAGVVFFFGQVKFLEDGQRLNIKFSYQIVRNENQLTNAELEPIMKVILNDILHEDLHGPT